MERNDAPFFTLVLNNTVVEIVTEMKVIGVNLDRKLTFDSHIMPIAISCSYINKPGIVMKGLCLFEDPVMLSICFCSFQLPVLQNCSPVWIVFNGVSFL